MMEKLFLLFLFFHVSSPVKHSLKYFATGSSGIPNFPEFMITVEFDNTVVGYCDNIEKKLETKQDWVKKILENEPEYEQFCKYYCFEQQPRLFSAVINRLMRLFNQTGGVHILQAMFSSEFNYETGEIADSIEWGYDGEDLTSLDLKTRTWITPKLEAETFLRIWTAELVEILKDEKNITYVKPDFEKKFVTLANDSLLKKELPSVFLLQQTPSSPVRCFASGFYPERASLFWRKDGDDLHEDVELGEILPNTDGTFQMSVDLKVSLVTPEDWRRYECVFQLFGVKDDIVTKLDETDIWTNWEPKDNTGVIVAAVVCPVLLILAAIGLLTYKLRGDMCSSSSHINTIKLSEREGLQPSCCG